MRAHVCAAMFLIAMAGHSGIAQQAPAPAGQGQGGGRGGGGRSGAAGAVGVETPQRWRSRDCPHGRPRQQHVVRLARGDADRGSERDELFRRPRESRCDPLRFRRSLKHADHQLRSAEAPRSAPPDQRTRRRRLPSPRDRRIDLGVSRRQHRCRLSHAAPRIRVREVHQRPADHHERRRGKPRRTGQACRGVRDRCRPREQRRSEGCDGRARRPR